MQTQNTEQCGMCGKSLIAEPKPTRLFDLPVHQACSKSFNQKRLYAVLIDLAIALVLLFGIGINLPEPPGTVPVDDNGMPVGALAVAGTFLLLRDAWRGISPGKALFGLQVVDADTDEPSGVRQSVQRNLVTLMCLAGWVPLAWGPLRFIGLSAWVIAFRMRAGPRDGEVWARTRVIDRKMRTAPVFTAPDLARIRKSSIAA
jgi:uncharacterized RDD family membrane protein YckC